MERKVYTLEDWKQRWDDKTTGWQREIPHEFLVKYFDQLKNDWKNVNVFLGLCGKSLDLIWLSERGCTVHGVEIWPQVIKEFFDEYQIQNNEKKIDAKCNRFQNTDKTISLFQCDIFGFNHTLSGCTYDLIWDRASFVAINPHERILYIKTLTDMLAKDGTMLLVTMNYDPESSPGPPHYVLDEDVPKYFGDEFNVKHLETRKVLEEQFRVKGLSDLSESLYLIRRNI